MTKPATSRRADPDRKGNQGAGYMARGRSRMLRMGVHPGQWLPDALQDPWSGYNMSARRAPGHGFPKTSIRPPGASGRLFNRQYGKTLNLFVQGSSP